MSSPQGQAQRTGNAPIIRSETWRRDGNVVLQAVNTQFRVHWSVLTLHSSVFRDMEGLPQPPGQPTVEGCPILKLSDDPDDVEYLLKALYIPEFHCQQTLPLQVVGAFVRLGRKYDFNYLLDSAVARLISEFPPTLEKFDAERTRVAVPTFADHLDAVTLIRQNNILSALPSAYFFAVMANSLCRAVREDTVKQCLDDTVILILTTPEFWKELFFKSKFCSACARNAAECVAAGRKKVWEELPAFFDLPPWSELKNDTDHPSVINPAAPPPYDELSNFSQ
ncbi:hypothetical protein K438DRAFT_1953963 [Mycena galopus ATCC 62051]|nr:hypothetical protein K438DRAFT_1953963 [Mycena galopus ATCC 62051]